MRFARPAERYALLKARRLRRTKSHGSREFRYLQIEQASHNPGSMGAGSIWWTIALLVGLVGAVLRLLDRMLLKAEQRGWIYWRHRKPHSSSLGSAMLTVQGLLEPDKQHVVEERQRQAADIDVAEDDYQLDG